MKARADAILKPAQAAYLDSLTIPRDALLARVEDFAAKNKQPIADPEVAQLLRILIRATKPKRILEVGTNIGYSVVVMGRECGPGTTLETIEIDPQILATAQGFVGEAKLTCDVRFHRGAALDVIATLDGPFDFVFIDCVKTEYLAYLDLLMPKMKSGAMIVCDNLLWGGKVGDRVNDEATNALRDFNQRITTDPRLMTVIMPLGDGTGISIVQ
jgi:predicted O-methyltransferase YrrM